MDIERTFTVPEIATPDTDLDIRKTSAILERFHHPIDGRRTRFLPLVVADLDVIETPLLDDTTQNDVAVELVESPVYYLELVAAHYAFSQKGHRTA